MHTARSNYRPPSPSKATEIVPCDTELCIITSCACFRLWKPFHNRKNFLFAGSNAGGDRAAAFYSLLSTAKLNGHNPEAFLRQVLTRIGDQPINRMTAGKLLPWNLNPVPVEQLSANDAMPALPAHAQA